MIYFEKIFKLRTNSSGKIQNVIGGGGGKSIDEGEINCQNIWR
jgi:hypothetical protein